VSTPVPHGLCLAPDSGQCCAACNVASFCWDCIAGQCEYVCAPGFKCCFHGESYTACHPDCDVYCKARGRDGAVVAGVVCGATCCANNCCGTTCCAPGQVCDPVTGICIDCPQCAGACCDPNTSHCCVYPSGEQACCRNELNCSAFGSGCGQCVSGYTCYDDGGTFKGCCASGQTCCHYVGQDGCVDLSTDPNNCGSCGHHCDANETCQGSRCVCGPSSEICVYPYTFCNGTKCVCGSGCDPDPCGGACECWCPPGSGICCT
jgi:hypothetical protein